MIERVYLRLEPVHPYWDPESVSGFRVAGCTKKPSNWAGVTICLDLDVPKAAFEPIMLAAGVLEFALEQTRTQVATTIQEVPDESA